eukprot:sb/3467639/
MKKELRSYSAVISQNCAAAVAPRRLQNAIKRATSPVEPEFDRSKNLMIFGLPEAENEDDASTRRRVTKVVSHLECSPVMTSTTRVGKKMETRPRPIKITLERREDLLLLLKKAKFLRKSDSLRTVYMSPDLTREEREDSTRLYQTLKQLRRDNPGRKYWERSRDKNKAIKMCSVLALVGVGAGIKSLRLFGCLRGDKAKARLISYHDINCKVNANIGYCSITPHSTHSLAIVEPDRVTEWNGRDPKTKQVWWIAGAAEIKNRTKVLIHELSGPGVLLNSRFHDSCLKQS